MDAFFGIFFHDFERGSKMHYLSTSLNKCCKDFFLHAKISQLNNLNTYAHIQVFKSHEHGIIEIDHVLTSFVKLRLSNLVKQMERIHRYCFLLNSCNQHLPIIKLRTNQDGRDLHRGFFFKFLKQVYRRRSLA